MSTIKEVQKALGINYIQFSEMFGYANPLSFANSSKRPVIEKGICELYDLILSKHPLSELITKEGLELAFLPSEFVGKGKAVLSVNPCHLECNHDKTTRHITTGVVSCVKCKKLIDIT